MLVVGLLAPAPAAGQSETPAGSKPGPQVPQGRAWASTTLDERHSGAWSLTAWEGGFAALGADPSGDRAGTGDSVWLSDDGSRWELIARPFGIGGSDARVAHIIGYRGGLVAVGRDGMRFAAWRSEDGRRWRRVHEQPAFLRPRHVPTEEYFLYLSDVAQHEGRLVVRGGYVPGGGDREHFDREWITIDGQRWRSGPSRWALATTTDERGLVGLRSPRPWPRNVDCDEGVLYEVVRSTDGRRWRRVPDSLLPCGNYTDLAYHEASDAYYAISYSGTLPQIERSHDLRTWSRVPLDVADFGHPRLDWEPERIATGEGLVVVAGSGAGDRFWTLISADGETWELSTAWPGMYRSQGTYGLAVAHGRIVALTDWRASRAWATDAVAPGEPASARLVGDCAGHDRATCLAIEAAVLDHVGVELVRSIRVLGRHVCPLLGLACERPTRTSERRFVDGVEVTIAGVAMPIRGNVWLPRAKSARPPRFDIIGLAG